jgi:hypothetical protein
MRIGFTGTSWISCREALRRRSFGDKLLDDGGAVALYHAIAGHQCSQEVECAACVWSRKLVQTWMDALRRTIDKEHLIRQTMNNLERQLDADRFARIHRSLIVNLGSVEELCRGEGGDYEVVLQTGTRLKLSRGYRQCLDRFDPLVADFAR